MQLSDLLLPEKDDQNEEAALTVNRLLFYREYFDDGGCSKEAFL